MRSHKRIARVLHITVASALMLVFAILLIGQSGLFTKAPAIDIQADNCYEQTLRVATDSDYKPYSFFDSNGNLSGHDIELVNILGNRLGMNIEYFPMTWSECLEAARSNSVDLVLTCEMNSDTVYSPGILFTTPLQAGEFVAFGKTRIESVDDLYGTRIGLMADGNANSAVYSLGLAPCCTEYPDNRTAFEALASNDCDYVIIRYFIGLEILQDMGKSGNGIQAFISISPSYLSIGVVGNNETIKALLDDQIISMKRDGTIRSLSEKWLTTFVKPYTLAELIHRNRWMLLTILILILSVIGNFFRSKARKMANDRENYRSAQVVEKLAQDFGCVNYVDLTIPADQDNVINYRVSETLREMIPGWECEKNFRRKLEMLRDTIVYEPDREHFWTEANPDEVIRKLSGEDVCFVTTRASIHNEIRHYQVKYSAVRDKNQLVGLVAGLHSVDEQIRSEMAMQKKLEDALSMAQSANRAKTVFLNSMSHDIRTPMNAIIGYTELAKTHMDNPEQVRDYLNKISQSSDHLLSLINDVLDMSRIESGKINLEEAEENIPEIITSLHDIIQADIDKQHHTFSLDMNLQNENVICDKLRLNQVLLNILSNSIKFTPVGGHISMSVSDKDAKPAGYGTYEFRIADNGIGMSEEYLKVLFEPFSRVRSSTVSGIQGTGLGMAITKNLVDMMGGRIEVRSEQHIGTEMTVTFNFRYCGHPVRKEGNPVQDDSAADLHGKKILLVEDNEMNREIATEILENCGALVTPAADGEIALVRIRTAGPSDYDLILMDIQMPVMDGYEATRRIRALGTDISRIPIVAMTANAFEEDRRQAIEAGMDEHITKPIDIRLLMNVLKKYL